MSNTRKYGVPVVVAINKFATDADSELETVRQASIDAGEHAVLKELQLNFSQPTLPLESCSCY